MVKSHKIIPPNKKAFTLLEMVFVITIIGILGAFSTDLVSSMYSNYINSLTHNRLQAQADAGMSFIEKKLQHRVKLSVVARDVDNPIFGTNFVPISNVDATHEMLEWVDGFYEAELDNDTSTTPATPIITHFIDRDDSTLTFLHSPTTDTVRLNALIDSLSNGDTDINDTALIFLGTHNDVTTNYAWDGVAINDQNLTLHPIAIDVVNTENIIPRLATGNFHSGTRTDYYDIVWTANALAIKNNVLTYYYDYQPWNGENYTDAKSVILMEDVSTFRFRVHAGSLTNSLQLQLCVQNFDGGYSLCKEKFIF